MPRRKSSNVIPIIRAHNFAPKTHRIRLEMREITALVETIYLRLKQNKMDSYTKGDLENAAEKLQRCKDVAIF